MLCENCQKREIAIKKHGLCLSCYQINRKKKLKLHPQIERFIYLRETEFIKNFFDHKNWVISPAIFRINNEKYTPDFYDAERNVFIEVVGSRQAYHANKEKYKLLKELYPKINFEVREYLGNLMEEDENGQFHWKGYKEQQTLKATA